MKYIAHLNDVKFRKTINANLQQCFDGLNLWMDWRMDVYVALSDPGTMKFGINSRKSAVVVWKNLPRG